MKETHFKDKEKINVLSHKSFDGYAGESNSWEIAKLLADEIAKIKSQYTSPEDIKKAMEEFLISPNVTFKEEPKASNHTSVHNQCDNTDIQNKSGRVTEKRICRCMNYYGRDKELCKDCKLERKYNIVDPYKVIDYEVPCASVMAGIGGVDLILENGNTQYAVEVKPPNSGESLVRMIAEILTYTLDLPDKYKDAVPAIAFFEKTVPTKSNEYKVTDSVQYRYFKDLRKPNEYSDVYKTLFSKVKIFLIRAEEKADNVWECKFIEQPEGMK